MADPSARALPSKPRQSLASMARQVRAFLESESRAGLVAVPRAGGAPASAIPDETPAPKATAIAGEEAPAPIPASRMAEALRQELHAHVATARTLDLFDFGTAQPDEGVSREDALARVAAEVAICDRCPELAAERTHTVPGQGNPRARLVFVGEGPGEEEDRQGLAFVGRAGELLTKMIEAIGMTREEVFIANIIKCRPPGNRLPTPDEAANCMPYLMRQLEVLRPRVICALGGTAAKALLQTHDGITRLRGRFYPYRGVLLMPTFHPAYVLRNYTPDTRKKVYDDLLKVKAELAK